MKKISKFSNKCKKIGIPLPLIIKIENACLEFDGKIYIVGGSVRDLIMNEYSTSNPDLVVNLDIKKLVYCLKKSKIKFLKIGEKYGSLVVLMKKFKFDITSMRSDVKTDGRWAEVKFTNNLIEDSKRRDFTFNSIYCDTNGNLHDPNNGINDLKRKQVRFIGDIHKRIKEDYLRILRFFRFSIIISQNFEKESYQICRRYFTKLQLLSYERRMQEIKKIILSNQIKKSKTLTFLKELFENTLESKLNFRNFIDLCLLESSQENISFERRIKFLLRGKESRSEFVIKNAENSFKKRLKSKIKFKSHSHKELNLNLFKFQRGNIIDQLFFDCSEKKISKEKFLRFYNFSLTFKKKKIPVSGDDLLKIGFKPGKILGNVLDELELLWAERDFKCTRNECIRFVQKFLP